MRPSTGSIVFQGRSLVGLAPERIARLGIAHVPEGRHVFPGFTVVGNLELAALAAGKAGTVIRQEMERVYSIFPVLAERRNQYAWSLSGGEQQMLVIGRGLMATPTLLLIDEPSLGLAPRLVEDVFEVIGSIAAAGTSVLLVEQNASIALEVARRAYVLELGRVLLEGKAEELTRSPLVQAAYLGSVADSDWGEPREPERNQPDHARG
jgi:branched-chain amino acid transport system ATP-binding protein